MTVELDRIGGKLEAADNLDWNDSTAEWDEVEGSKSYDVKLLRRQQDSHYGQHYRNLI